MQQQGEPVIRLGVLGLSRGRTFAKDSELLGVKLVAVCDWNEDRLHGFKREHGHVATYTDYDRFLEHDMDAVVVANYFHQHAPVAIKALRAGKHVLSETAACKTIQEGVELCREVEKSGKIYMFAENCNYFKVVLTMREQYRNGVVGDVKYAEGEYVHPVPKETSFQLAPGLDHWRNHLPSTYYCTHTLGPLMYMTDTMPATVNALSITATPELDRTRIKHGDPASVILCRMDNGAVFRLLFGGLAARPHYYFRVHGFKGKLDTIYEEELVRIGRNSWELREGEQERESVKAAYPMHESVAQHAGHGGGDFWIVYHFAEAIRSGRQPYLDVYRGVAMSVVGILALKSAHQNGAPFDVPDFKDEAARKRHERDDWSPWPEDRRPGQPWPSVRGELAPTAEALASATKLWEEKGLKV
ncbi:MAG: glycosyl hydrolase family protein 2 [Paenibacillus sp.]|nr:glycosyl hydrolase family protein 2 [Paenibacillus sp.]